MDVVCEDCGESNRPGTEFCLFCGTYLPWAAGTGEAPPAAAAGPVSPPVVLPPVAPAPATEPPVHVPGGGQSQPVRTSTVTAAPGEPRPTVVPEGRCPECSVVNPSERFFCSRCGHQLRPSPAAQRLPPARRRELSWWNRIWDTRDRSARRAYRQSLPAAYRWRRLVVGVLVVALVATFGVVSRGRPVAWVRSRVDDLRGTLVPVPGVRASVEPAGATVPPTTPGSLLDRTGQAWTTAWSAAASANSCGPAPGTPMVVLNFPPRRVRAVEIYAGLSDTLPERDLQFRPARLAVIFDDGSCREVALEDRYRSEAELDTGSAVTRLRIGVMSAHPAAAGGQEVLSISEVALLARPAR